MEKTEIYLLSGFLGSGKTTLLKRLLEEERGMERKVAVMMNELGKVSIDSNEVEEDISLKELLGGCVCCSLQDELEAQLQELFIAEKPEVIYIETTGAAHPVEVLDAVLSPLFADYITIKGIITTVDGLRWKDRLYLSPNIQQLLLEQVRYANLILINKMDELNDFEQAQATYEIQSLNAHVRCLLTNYSKVPIDQVRKLSMSVDNYKEKPKNHNRVHLSTFVYLFQSSIQSVKFEEFLSNLPSTIYRIKGYIQFDQSEYPTLFQFSYGVPLYMKEEMKMPLNLVFIGEGIDWNIIEIQLKSLEINE
ncbi:MAG TPA: GTP-binding protein [Bacillales bacterium]|nr:GTP-binding protein [Bacillales bacterium]